MTILANEDVAPATTVLSPDEVAPVHETLSPDEVERIDTRPVDTQFELERAFQPVGTQLKGGNLTLPRLSQATAPIVQGALTAMNVPVPEPVARGAVNAGLGVVESAANNPEMTAAMIAAPEVAALTLAPVMAAGVPGAVKETAKAAKEGDIAGVVEGTLKTSLTALGAVAPFSALREVPKTKASLEGKPPEPPPVADTAPLTAEILKQEVPNAVQKQAANEVGVRNPSGMGGPVGEGNAPSEVAPKAGEAPQKVRFESQELRDAGFASEREWLAKHAEEGLKAEGDFEAETPEEYLMRKYCAP